MVLRATPAKGGGRSRRRCMNRPGESKVKAKQMSNELPPLSEYQLAARCEMAFKKYIDGAAKSGARWLVLHDDRYEAHFNDFIIVKPSEGEPTEVKIEPDERSDFAFVLVAAESKFSYAVIGWIWGVEAKQAEYLSDDGVAYFVPRGKLRDMTELVRELETR
jgi:hypothetical protein